MATNTTSARPARAAAAKTTARAKTKPAAAAKTGKATTEQVAPAVKQRKVARRAAAAGTQPKLPPALTPEQRRYYVEVAAYYIAERRGFQGGSQMDDWVQAEAEIDRLLREGVLQP